MTECETTAGVVVESLAGERRVTQIGVNDPRWQDFVASHPDRSIFHHPAWSKALMEESGRTPFALACEGADGSLLGILPLLETRGVPFNLGDCVIRRRLSSLPRTPFAGPLSTRPDVREALVRAAADVALKERTTLELRSFSEALEGTGYAFGVVRWKESHAVPLVRGGNELRLGNAHKTHRVRWAVNKAHKLGVAVQWAGAEEDLRTWYGLYLDTMRWHMSPPRAYRVLASLWRNLHPSGLMRLLLAYRAQGGADELLSGCVYLALGKSFYCWLNGRRRDQLGFHPNDAIHWEAMTTAWREGFEFYDLGQVEEGQQGLIEFKSKWGAEPRRSYRYYFPAPKRLRAPAPESSGNFRRVAKRLWRSVPLPVTARIGDWVYRYL